jgi:sigma-E factor negative regulatory protein RseA
MNEKKLEALSALMDGETTEPDAGTLHDWSRDEGMRAAWARYHIIADCLRGSLPRYIDPALANRISMALRSEPSIIAAPQTAVRRAWLKPVAGMAIAASVATLAVIGIQMNRGAAGGAHVAAGPHATGAASGGQFNLASGSVRPRPQRYAAPGTAIDPRMNRYLINYSEQRTGNTVQGMPPYVRIIAEDKETQP